MKFDKGRIQFGSKLMDPVTFNSEKDLNKARRLNVDPKEPTSILDQATVVSKGWAPQNVDENHKGIGEVFVYHPGEVIEKIDVQTVKLLYIDKGKRLSRHFHKHKSEYFYMVKGSIKVETWDWNDSSEDREFVLEENQRFFMPAMTQHRMTGIGDENILLEVSTLDVESDSYRIEKGD
jgi:mannose-6-phosphate isomerase-like protein (cupin superfamily)